MPGVERWSPPRVFDGLSLAVSLRGSTRVFAARDGRSGAGVVLKVAAEPFESLRAEKAFAREVRALARVDHESVVRVVRHGAVDDHPYVAYERVDGRPLDELASPSDEEVAAIARALVAALGAVHRAGLLHRDVRPANVLVSATGKVTLVDFGLAGMRGAGSAGHDHLAPELRSGGRATVATEVYGAGSTIASLARACGGLADLGRVCARATAEHAADRHGSLRELERALDGAAPEPRESAPPLAAPTGPDHVVRRCLGVRPGERVVVLRHRADLEAAEVRAAVKRAGAEPVDAALDAGDADLAELLDGADRTILIAADGLPPALSMAVLREAERLSLAHLHLTRADPRLFEQSYRADPARIARINERLRSAIGGDVGLEVSSPRGTALTIRLSSRYSLLSGDGQPQPGAPQNLPSGYVAAHPASCEGTLVTDRLALGYRKLDRRVLRRRPLVIGFEDGRATSVEGADEETRARVAEYLDADVYADRAGLVVIPTNYVVRAESGIDIQDALLPGLSVGLGFTFAEVTRAIRRCPVQLRLFGRQQTVEVGGGPTIVERGRLAERWVRGADLFRA